MVNLFSVTVKKLLLLGLLLLTRFPAPGANRFDEFTEKFAKTPDQAQVVAATYLGGNGTEWLAGGGFQPDGTVVVAGVALGPKLDLGGRETVLGRDAVVAAPERAAKKDKQGKPELDKQGKPKFESFTWRHENATAFVARLSPDLKQLLTVTRLGWKSGGLTGCTVDAQGNIYVCGPATEAIASISADAKELPVPDTGAKGGACQHTYLAKLTPDGAKTLWVRHFKAPSGAPDVSVGRGGEVYFQGPDLRTFSADGRQTAQSTVPGGLGGRVAVNPLDGTYARGGETRNWSTGREPYRDPVLNIHRPDGSLLYELYHWDGPLVGLNNLRLVSDSVVRGVCYDDDGNLLIHAWADGGNSVLLREPTDVRAVSRKLDGLGFSAWGAGVLSSAYLIKIDPRTYKVAGGTLWLAFLRDKNKPNSININTLGFARDGSVCIGGSSAWGLIQTANAFPGEPGGSYVAVLNKDCTALRFSSNLPATGQAEVTDGARWAVVSGVQNGRARVLFLSGAVDQEDSYGLRPAPTLNPRQPKFGGGFSDGHILLLDLSAKTGQPLSQR